MTWQDEVNELKRRQALARQMGGDESIAKQHSKGRLTIRERIDLLLDRNSFEEVGTLAGDAKYDDEGELESFTPLGTITGHGQIDGKAVCIVGDDFTVHGGSTDVTSMYKRAFITKMAQERHLPLICLYDSAGGRVKEAIERTITPTPVGWSTLTELGSQVPVVAAVLGTAAGWIAVMADMAHWSVMTKTSELFVAGPPIIKRALGIDITKEELGNYKIHAYQTGVIDNVAEDESDAFRQIKLFLSYLPQNVWHQPPRVESGDDPNRRDKELLSIIPKDPRKTYNIRQLIKHIVDKDSIFEISPFYGKSVVTLLARLDGYPVAVMSNDSTWIGGAQDVPGTEKITRFIDLADTFHLPIVYLMDVPGYMIGPDAEKTGTLRAAARQNYALYQATTPWATVLLGRCFGVAGSGHGNYDRLNLRYAWPSANWGSIPIAGGAMAEYRKEIEAAPDPVAKRMEIEKHLRQLSSPFRTAEAFGRMGVEEIIDPQDTRPLLCGFARRAQEVTATQLGPKFRGWRP